MSLRFRPHRSLRSELLPLSVAVLVPAVLFAVFPIAATRPLPPPPQSAGVGGSCAFVTLTPDQERHAIAAARAAWQLDKGVATRLRVDLFADSLPAAAPRDVLDISSRPCIDRTAPEAYKPDEKPPTLAAPPPAVIAPQPDAEKVVSAFAREELLKLN